MDLFSITCTTCKTRLKVREESAIGQILACPKCGGMVMVKPPEGWQKGKPLALATMPEPPASITTVVEMRRPEETLGDSQFDAIEELFGDAPPKARPSNVRVAEDAPGLARPRFVNGPPAAGSHAANGHAGGSAPVSKKTENAPASDASSAAPAPNTANTLPPPPAGAGLVMSGSNAAPGSSAADAADASKPPPPAEVDVPPACQSVAATPAGDLRYWLMMAGSVAAGIGLALTVVVGMIWFFRDDALPVAESGPQVPLVTNTANVPAGAPTTGAETPATGSAANASPTSDPPENNPPTPVDPTPPIEPDPAESSIDPGESPAGEGDPLGLVDPQPPVKPANANDPLAKFDELIAGDPEDPLVKPVESTESAPLRGEVDPSEDSPARPSMPRPLPREIDLAARLADPLPGIETSGTPLADFLRVISDLSTIPIVLETEGLPLVSVTPESPVVLKAANTTVGGALSAALTPLRLEHVAAEGLILVRVAEPAEMPTLSFPVNDLTAGDEGQMGELAEAIKSLVAPDAWNESAGGTIAVNVPKGTLDIRQRRAVHAPLLIAFEKLRTARKLPYATGTKYDALLFALGSRFGKARAKLETPVSLTFAQPTNFVRILNQLESAAGVRILVDWQDIAAAGWNADGEALLVAEKQPLAAALDALLGPMDLAWRVVNSRTVEVVTPARLADDLELELYKVDKLVAADPSGGALVGHIRAALGEELFLDAGGRCDLRYDEPGQCLLASLPQPKQRELESLLEQMLAEASK
jgi:hypothetical protein